MTRLFLLREDGDGTAMRDALAEELGMEVVFRTAADPPVEGGIALPLYPQSNDVSRRLARTVARSTQLVWFSYLDAYAEAVAQGLFGPIIFCAEDLPDRHGIYRRDVTQSAAAIAAKAGVTYQLVFGDSPPEGTRVALTIPIPCETATRWGAQPAWGCHPPFIKALADLVRRALSDDD